MMSENSPSETHDANLSAGEQQSEISDTTVRKHVTKACERCRAAKAKCDDNHPCARCASRRLSCDYSSAVDLRSRASMKRKIDALERDNRFLHALFERLRDTKDVQAAQVVSLIRSDVSLQEVHLCLSEMSQENASKRRHVSPEIEDGRNVTNAFMATTREPETTNMRSQDRKSSAWIE